MEELISPRAGQSSSAGETHQGAWNFTNAFLPARLDLKFPSLSVTAPAEAPPTRPRITARRIILETEGWR